VRQAHLLEGAVPLPNDVGLAVGLAMTERGTHYMLLPGPPREMAPMFENYGKPWLKTVLPDAQPLYSLMLKFAGIGESALEEALADLIERQSDPTLAPYASEGEVTIRLTTRARSREEAERKMRPTEAIIRERVGAHLYATEDIPLEEAIVRRLAAIGKTFAAAESCTGGLIAQLATNVPGSSAVFCGGIVCYTNEVKHRLLDVPTDLLEGEQAPGAVSGETAARLAEQARKRLGSDFAISVTGVAGPSASEGKPVGLVYIGIAAPGRSVRVAKFHFNGNRETIRMKAAKQALYELWQTIGEPSGGA
jgi:nicotinamide-nucleotide amidase